MEENCEDSRKSEIYDIGLEIGTILKSQYVITGYVSIGQTSILYSAGYVEDESRETVLIKEFCPYSYANRDLDKKAVLCKNERFHKQYKKMLSYFERECEILKDLKQIPQRRGVRIVRYIDSFQENDTCYLVMEYIEGTDLLEVLQSGRKLDYKKTIRSIISLVRMIHARGILHLDLKPSNLLVTKEDEIVLIDFGSARYVKEGRQEMSFASKYYSAPEIFRNETCTMKTDIYSVGVMIYYLTTGIFPPCAKDRMREDTIKKISSYIDIPPVLEYFIMKTLEINVKKRLNNLAILYILYL